MKECTTDPYWRADTTTKIKPAVKIVLSLSNRSAS